MKYELYEQIRCNENIIILFCFESNNMFAISSYMENSPIDSNSKYIILNNVPTSTMNYLQLGFDFPPTEKELYDIIFDCKLAKEQHHQIKESDFDECYLNSELTTKISNSIFSVAKLQTEIYFEKYNKIKK